jgi:hypothetical protein
MLKYHELVYNIGKIIQTKLKEFEPPFILLINMDLYELISYTFKKKKKNTLWEELYMLTTFKGKRIIKDIISHSEQQPIILYQTK